MALYEGTTATEASTGGSYAPGLYKFKIVDASLTDWGAVNYELQTKAEDGSEGPKVYDSLKLQSTSDAMKDEINRRLTTLLGKPSIDKPEDLIGKVGFVVLRQGPKYLEASPWGGYFDAAKLSATGQKDSIDRAIKQGIEYDYTKDDYVMNKLQQSQGHLAGVSPETEGDMPF